MGPYAACTGGQVSTHPVIAWPGISAGTSWLRIGAAPALRGREQLEAVREEISTLFRCKRCTLAGMECAAVGDQVVHNQRVIASLDILTDLSLWLDYCLTGDELTPTWQVAAQGGTLRLHQPEPSCPAGDSVMVRAFQAGMSASRAICARISGLLYELAATPRPDLYYRIADEHDNCLLFISTHPARYNCSITLDTGVAGHCFFGRSQIVDLARKLALANSTAGMEAPRCSA